VIGRVSKDGLMVRDARRRAPHHEGPALAPRRLLFIRRQGRRTLAERALHHHGVKPAAEFETNIRIGPDHRKSAP